jgi:endogenous inhibitor of DNA gyrase (YacG/DUF329 family)
LKHRCSICGNIYEFEYQKGGKLPPHFPFCSDRCKAIDFSKWLNEDYRITTVIPNAEMMSETEKEVLAQFLLDEGEVDEIFDEDE